MDKKQILIVEDDPDTCLLLSKLFEKIGYELTITNNGQDAIVSINTKVPDLVIFDVNMPGMDGWETFELIREGWDIPALCLSASSFSQFAAQALQLGEVDYIHKPFYNDELLARVNALVNPQAVQPAHQAAAWDTGKNRHPKVSVIIPTLNEADNLPLIFPYIPMNWVDEVILVDGCSTDGTVQVARRLFPSIKVVLEKTPGKGAALQAGFQAAGGDILVVMDADGSHDPREIPRFVNALLQGADFVKGSRFAPGGGTTDMPRYRQMGNGVFVLLTNLLFSASFTDLCYGYHAFWKYCLEAIDLDDVNGFEIDTALYLGALRKRLRITEVPSFEGYRFNGQGKLKTIPDGLRVLLTITRQSLKNMAGASQANYPGFRGMTAGSVPVAAKTRVRRVAVKAGASSATAGNPQASSATAGDLKPAGRVRAERAIPASQRSEMATVINPRYEKKARLAKAASGAASGHVEAGNATAGHPGSPQAVDETIPEGPSR